MMMYDIHMHIVPGVDDGSWNMEMSEQMLCMAYSQGIRKIIAAPHSYAFSDPGNDVERRFHEMKEMAAKILPDLQLYPGCEVRCQSTGMDAVVEGLRSGRIPTLNSTKYVLTEFSSDVEPAEAIECVRRLTDSGYLPVAAHTERYRNLFEKSEYIERLQNMGCMFQINVYSVFDEPNERIRENARRLVDERRVTFLGSDAHRTIHRPPGVRYGLEYLYRHYDKEYADQIAFRNAGKMLNMI